jgi:site-specific DNA recombinase
LPRIALYARVSTDGQTVEVQRTLLLAGLGPDDQLVRDDEADQDVFEDQGWSGSLLERPALTRLRDHVRSGSIDQVRALAPDRLSRDLADKLFLAKEFRAKEVIIADPQGRPFADTSTPWGFALDALQGVVAQVERLQILERTTRGRLQRAKEGRVVNPGDHYWLCWDKPTKSYLVKERQSTVVRQIINWVLEGASLQQIVYRLTDLAVPTATGRKWHTSTISKMLRNPALKGDKVQHRLKAVEPSFRKSEIGKRRMSARARPQDEWIIVPVPAIISAELFDEVQRRLADNWRFASRNAKNQYLLSGLLRCDHCGRAWVGTTIDTWPRKTAYRCLGKQKRNYYPGTKCTTRTIQAYRVEEVIWDAVCRLLERPDIVLAEVKRLREKSPDYYAQVEQELHEIDSHQLPRIARERDVVLDSRRQLPELYTIELTAAEMAKVDAELRRHEQRRVELVDKLQQRRLSIEQIADVARYCERIRSHVGNASFEQKRGLIRLLVNRVVTDGAALSWEFTIRIAGQQMSIEQSASVAPIASA